MFRKRVTCSILWALKAELYFQHQKDRTVELFYFEMKISLNKLHGSVFTQFVGGGGWGVGGD